MQIFLDLCVVINGFKNITIFKFLLIRNDPSRWLGLFHLQKVMGRDVLPQFIFTIPSGTLTFLQGTPLQNPNFLSITHLPNLFDIFVDFLLQKAEKYHPFTESQSFPDYPQVEFLRA